PPQETCGLDAGLYSADRDAAAVLADTLEHDLPVDQREEAVVATLADAQAWHDARPVLADDDRAGADALTAERLDAQALRVRVAPVAARAPALLVRHLLAVLRRCGRGLLPRRSRPGRLRRLLGRLGLRRLLGLGRGPDGEDLQGRQVRPRAAVHADA